MLIRAAHESDSHAAVDVVREVYEEYNFTWDEGDYHADLYDLKQHYLNAGHKFWIAEDDNGRAVGVVALEIFNPVLGENGKVVSYQSFQRIAGCDCALQRLYVRPSARNMGVGTALMQRVVETARALGRKQLEIWSDKRFVEAHKLYGKFGAIQVGDRICHDPDQSPEFGLFINL